MTAIEGEARKPAAGVRDRRRRPADLARRRRRRRSGCWLVTPDGLLLMAVEGLAGANLLVGVLNLVPGPAARRRPGAQGRASGGSPATCTAARSSPAGAAGSPPSLVLSWPLRPGAAARRPPGRHRLRPRVRHRAVPLVRRHRGDRRPRRLRRRLPRLVARDLARRTLAVPEDLPLAEAVRRAQEAAGRQHRHRRPAPAARSGWSTRRRCSPPPRSAGRGSRSRPWPARSTTGLRLPVDHRRRGPDPRDQPDARPRSTSSSRPTARVYGVLATADVDRGVPGVGRRRLERSEQALDADDVRPRPGPASTAARCGRASGCG